MDVGAAGMAAREVTVCVQPGERALYLPAVSAEARAVRGPSTRQTRGDPASPERQAVGPRVISAVGKEPPRAELAVAPCGRDAIDQGDQLGYVMAVGGSERRRQRRPVAGDDQMVL